ncbi:SsgA family sporulation/cell division regulator [Streptomyces rochei]|uniref:SsgA family sporulation/cell division regulator n=1 Tax=Streptomyces TaxID=1883 RepID=UPI0021AE7F55|nr:SsgA family sporulation/cell division regulator [Streptomyces sp. WAC06273]
MNVRSEGAMNTSEPLDDDDFDALLDASSLGAPRVVAALGSATPDARRRFNAAAHHPPSDSTAPADPPADTGVQTQRPASSSPAVKTAAMGLARITVATGAGKTHTFLNQISQTRRRRDIAEVLTSRLARFFIVVARPRPFVPLPLYALDDDQPVNPFSAQAHDHLAALLNNRVTACSKVPRYPRDLNRLFYPSSGDRACRHPMERAAEPECDLLHDILAQAGLRTADGACHRAATAVRFASWEACMQQGTGEQSLQGQAWPQLTAAQALVDPGEMPAALDGLSFPRMLWSTTGGPHLHTMRYFRDSCLRLASMPPDVPSTHENLLRRIAQLGSVPERSSGHNGLVFVSTQEWHNWLHATACAGNDRLPVVYACATSEKGHVTAPWPETPRALHLATVRGLSLACRTLHGTGHATPNDQHGSAAVPTAEKKQQHDTGDARIEAWQGVVHASITARLHRGADRENSLPVLTHLTYRVTDPYAVEAVFDPGPRQVTWTFARDLLADGLHGWAGSGDINVWTSSSASGRPRTFMRLTSPNGTALLSLPPAPVREFLTETDRMVARGSEHALVSASINDLEAHLNQLSALPGNVD